MLNPDKLKKFEDVEIKFEGEQAAVMGSILARFAYMMNAELDEDEASDIIEEFLEKNSLDVRNVHELAMMVKSTAFDGRKDKVH